MIFLIAAITLIALLLIYLFVSYFLAGTIIHLNRQPVPKNPKDYNMDFEDIEFITSDEVKIKGWFIPGVGVRNCISATLIKYNVSINLAA